jgi:hypothetical protein
MREYINIIPIVVGAFYIVMFALAGFPFNFDTSSSLTGDTLLSWFFLGGIALVAIGVKDWVIE